MEDKNNRTDRYFRDRLAGFGQGPPDSAWDNIVTRLGSKKKKKFALIFFRIAAGMAILVSTGIGIYLLRTGERDEVTPVVSERTMPETVIRPQQPKPPAIIAESIRETKPDEYISDVKKPEQHISFRAEVTNIRPEALTAIEFKMPLLMLPDGKTREPDLPAITGKSETPVDDYTELMLAGYYGEDGSPEKPNEYKWSLGSEIAPLYSNRSIRSSGLDASSINNLNDSESGILAYAGGVKVAFSPGRRLSVQSGIYYSRYGQEKNHVQAVEVFNNLYFNQSDEKNYKFLAVSNSTGAIPGVVESGANSVSFQTDMVSGFSRSGVETSNVDPLVQGDVDNVSLRQYFDYFEVPLILKYKIIDRKIDFSFSGGVVTNFLVGNSVSMINDGKKTIIGETTGINHVNYSGSIGLGLEYPVVSNFFLTVEPRFRYYLNPIDRNSIMSVHPYSFGFFAGINYRF